MLRTKGTDARRDMGDLGAFLEALSLLIKILF